MKNGLRSESLKGLFKLAPVPDISQQRHNFNTAKTLLKL
jgi:hypothetical protein